MQIAILGLGAIGSVMAWKLKKQGHKVVSANLPRTFSIHQQGQPSQNISIDEWKDEPIDWLIICTKAGQTLEAVKPILAKTKLIKQVLCIQNGMGQHQELAKQMPDVPIWAGVSTEGAYRIDKKNVQYAAKGQTLIGVVAQAKKANPKVIPSPFHLAENINLIMLNKLAVNAVINPLTAYFKCTNGELLNDAHKAHFVKLCNEIRLLYEALNWPKVEPFIQRVAQIAKQTQSNRSSSLQDVLAGRKTELAYINGYLIEKAKHINHPMPLSEFYLQHLAH